MMPLRKAEREAAARRFKLKMFRHSLQICKSMKRSAKYTGSMFQNMENCLPHVIFITVCQIHPDRTED